MGQEERGGLCRVGSRTWDEISGTYYYALGTGANLNAQVCVMWEFSKYGDIDAALKTFKDPEGERITRESLEFAANVSTPTLFLRPIGEGKFYEGT